jgi:serine/threonine protein kinase
MRIFNTAMNRPREMSFPSLPLAIEHNDTKESSTTATVTGDTTITTAGSSSNNRRQRALSSSSSKAELEDEQRVFRLPNNLLQQQRQHQHLSSAIQQWPREEMKLGRIIGRGSFAVVRGIRSLPTSLLLHHQEEDRRRMGEERRSVQSGTTNSTTSTSVSTQGSTWTTEQKRQPKKNRQHSHRYTYVLKEIDHRFLSTSHAETDNSQQKAYHRAIVDLATEAKFMSELVHDHIVQLRGTTITTTKTTASGSVQSDTTPRNLGLIMEYLPETLTRRLGDWSQQDRACKGITGFVTRSRSKASQLFQTRLRVAHDIASALQHLHSHNIIFRDVSLDVDMVVTSVH